MTPPEPRRRRAPVFLERQSYRRRRLMDAARVLPFLGLLLWLVPLLWPQGQEGGVRSSSAIVYLFGVWAFLVLGSAVLVYALGRREEAETGE
ncbi:hypothetical protein ACFSDD_16460 [Salipiger marinus]|jgi:fatty acid desaturase|uniref:Uncharacterized protein n=1 Tax=Salipiger marinus TaxID=555512 RepID=A0A1G8LMU1_9RHOB|nr:MULTISPECIES: hypothetical protein [Salipiger]HBM61753.1 hypothetical protein [Citreicella sp.]MCD1620811.1 hypothetical protein [Salipiger manganoxidans]MEB3418522.1 hypothetical protein [Salipiger manganoxidans]SDI56935.1 hypothetical protein SAMN04487993_1006261 [Salipiger marinus]HBS99869.1 hypothetical protein [Citreicella sp.]